MATRIQLRRGNTSDHSTFTGAEGEVTVDTDKNTIVVHDGSEAGGYPLVSMDGSDIKMQVDGDGAKSSRIVFDSIQHPHSEDGDGFTNPVFIIQGNYDSTASYGGVVGTEYLSANISQLGNGDLNISAGKLRLRGKRYYDNDPTGDDKYAHISYMGLSLDGDETQGTVLRLHWGLTNNTNQNIRLQPSENGIIVEGMGDASSPTPTKSNTGTIGTFNDEDLLTLAENSVTVNGDFTIFHEDTDSNPFFNPYLILQRKTAGTAEINDRLGEILFRGENSDGNDVDYIRLRTTIADATAGEEDAKFNITALKDGTYKNLALFRSGLVSFGQRVSNEDQAIEFNGPVYGRVGGVSGSRFVHSEQGLNLEGVYTNPPKGGVAITSISNTSSGTACVVTTDGNHGFTDNMFLYVDNTGNSLLDGKSFFIMTVDGQPTQLTLNNAYDGGDPQHSGATSSSGVIGGLGYGLRIHNTQTDSAYEQDCSLELGGNDDVFIDLKRPNDDDYDLRLAHLNNDTSYLTSKTGGLVLKTETDSNILIQRNNESKVSITDDGINVTGTVTADGMAIYTSTGNISASTLVTERGKRIIINGDHDITLPDATADEVGYTWVIHNTHSGAITLDKGTADQTVKHLTGSAVTTITVATGTSVNIASGGVAELVCTAADNYIIFGSGIS